MVDCGISRQNDLSSSQGRLVYRNMGKRYMLRLMIMQESMKKQ